MKNLPWCENHGAWRYDCKDCIRINNEFERKRTIVSHALFVVGIVIKIIEKEYFPGKIEEAKKQAKKFFGMQIEKSRLTKHLQEETIEEAEDDLKTLIRLTKFIAEIERDYHKDASFINKVLQWKK